MRLRAGGHELGENSNKYFFNLESSRGKGVELERYGGGVCINFVVPLGTTVNFSFHSLFSAVPLETSEQSPVEAYFLSVRKMHFIIPLGKSKGLAVVGKLCGSRS